MVNVLPTAQGCNNYFTGLGNWIGFCTGAPGGGGGGVVLNEAAGGSPAYARKATTWTPGINGSAVGSAIVVNLPAGTYPYAIMCAGSTGNNMVDWCILPTPIVISVQTAITFNPSTASV